MFEYDRYMSYAGGEGEEKVEPTKLSQVLEVIARIRPTRAARKACKLTFLTFGTPLFYLGIKSALISEHELSIGFILTTFIVGSFIRYIYTGQHLFSNADNRPFQARLFHDLRKGLTTIVIGVVAKSIFFQALKWIPSIYGLIVVPFYLIIFCIFKFTLSPYGD